MPSAGDDLAYIFPTPLYTGVACGKASNSVFDNCNMRLSRFLEAIWARTMPSCCSAKAALEEISCSSYIIISYILHCSRESV